MQGRRGNFQRGGMNQGGRGGNFHRGRNNMMQHNQLPQAPQGPPPSVPIQSGAQHQGMLPQGPPPVRSEMPMMTGQ